eukprot:3366856-Prymnesium_polylepis.1
MRAHRGTDVRRWAGRQDVLQVARARVLGKRADVLRNELVGQGPGCGVTPHRLEALKLNSSSMNVIPPSETV